MSGLEFVRFLSPVLKKKSALKLKLSKRKSQGVYLDSKTLQELMKEKAKVKEELKSYDRHFISKVGKAPSNKEKEPLK